MSLSPEQIDTLGDKYIIDLYNNLEADVIADIARRVKKMERFTETAEIMAKTMVEHGYSATEIQAEVFKVLGADKEYQAELALNTKQYKQEIKMLIEEIELEAQANGDMLVANAGTMAWNDDMQMWAEHGVDLTEPNSLDATQHAMQLQMADKLYTINQSLGFRNTALGYNSILNAFHKEMDLAILKVASGTFSYDQVVKDCVHRLALSGLRSIDYASNRSYELDTAARMIVRTVCSQLAGKITEGNMETTGAELVYVSAHAGARPSHAAWQGKAYYYDSRHPVKGYDDFKSSTGYGRIDGLKGVNCTHEFYPYWDGDPIPDFVEPQPVTVDGRTYTYYDATQEQRKMERGIRATKREIMASNVVGLDTKDLKKQLDHQSRQYHSFSKAVGIRAKDNRLTVGKVGTFDMNRTKAQKKANKIKSK